LLKKLLEILENNNLFLTGGAGVGKSYMASAIIDHFKGLGKQVAVLGSTGISAVGIGGVTLHSFFCLGICKDYNELRDLDRFKSQKERVARLNKILKNTDLIVIDEISMISPQVFELVYFRLINGAFNGRILVIGDFFQLPPVNVEKNLFLGSKYAFSALAWSEMNFKIVELVGSKRTKSLEFDEKLSLLRVGELNANLSEYLCRFLSPAPNDDDSVICGTNAQANRINSERLAKIPEPLVVSKGQIECENPQIYEQKLISWQKNFQNFSTLELKRGAKVLFTINRKFDDFSIYNGESGEICDFIHSKGVCEEIVVRKSSGEIVQIGKNSYDLIEYESANGEIKENLIASFYQFPLRLSYGLTIHKSQGMSISRLSCDVNRIFADGQFYVALSRATDPLNLRILYSKPAKFREYLQKAVKTDAAVKNFYQNSDILRLKS